MRVFNEVSQTSEIRERGEKYGVEEKRKRLDKNDVNL